MKMIWPTTNRRIVEPSYLIGSTFAWRCLPHLEFMMTVLELTYFLTSVWPQQHPCTPSVPSLSCMVFLVGWALHWIWGANTGTRGRLPCRVKGPVRGHPWPIQKDVTQHILHNVNILPYSQHLLTMDDCAQPSYCVQSWIWLANLW